MDAEIGGTGWRDDQRFQIFNALHENDGGLIRRYRAGCAAFTDTHPLIERSQAWRESRRYEAATLRILIVEDDVSLVRVLRSALEPTGISIDHVAGGPEAVRIAQSETYSLITLNLPLPELAGEHVLRELRGGRNSRVGTDVPILIVTANNSVADKVKYLNLGADDYLTKPFHLGEFEARIRALNRRAKGRAIPTLACGALTFETVSATATLHGAALSLRRREATVLGILISHAGKTVRKDRLISEIFGFDDAVSPNAIELYVARLRDKLGTAGPRIRTVKGVGYMMEIE
jgi:DNA-binding response OmpR family regulator